MKNRKVAPTPETGEDRDKQLLAIGRRLGLKEALRLIRAALKSAPQKR